MLFDHTELFLQIIDGQWVILKRWKAFSLRQNALSEGVIEFILIFYAIALRLYSKFERKLQVWPL